MKVIVVMRNAVTTDTEAVEITAVTIKKQIHILALKSIYPRRVGAFFMP